MHSTAATIADVCDELIASHTNRTNEDIIAVSRPLVA